MDANWRLEPRRGLGQLVFGLSVDEVATLAPIYGQPSLVLSQAHVIDDFEKVLAMPGRSPMAPEDIARLRRNAEALRHYATQVLGALNLDYVQGRLDAIMVGADSPSSHFEGQLVFALKPREVLVLFERANGEPGRYNSTEAAFDKLAVSLHGFSMTRAKKPHAVSESDETFRTERSITLRCEPYRPEDEMDQFVTATFL